MCRRDAAARLERRALIQTDGCREKLNGQCAADIDDDLLQLARCDAAHAHVVLPARAGRNRVDRRGVTENLVLADERGARDLRNHQPRVKTTGFRKEGCQASRQRWIHELLDAALADVGQFCDRDRREVERKSNGLSVKVASADDARPSAVVQEDARVASYRMDLPLNPRARVRKRIAGGTMDLRPASQAAGVL